MKWDGLASTAPSKRIPIKKGLIGYYLGKKAVKKQTIKCMLLDVELDKSVVIGSHIFKHEWEKFKGICGLDNINDHRNCMLLFQPIEKAFDSSQLCFILDKTSGKLVLKLLNPNLKNTTVYRAAKNLNISDEAMGSLDKKLKFGDLDGKPLKSSTGKFPFKSLLNLHARTARDTAIKNNWIQQSWNFEDFVSKLRVEILLGIGWTSKFE